MEQHDVRVLVSDLVAERPSRSRIFEALGIEYCCNGQRPLLDACREQGLDAQVVLDTLLATEAADSTTIREPNWTEMPPTALVDDIVRVHHSFLRSELPRLAELAGHVETAHSDREPRLMLIRTKLGLLQSEIESHLDREEREVFPALLEVVRNADAGEGSTTQAGSSVVREAMSGLEEEHRSTAGLLNALNALTDSYRPPEWACNSLRAFYSGLHDLATGMHLHVHKENNILFPAVARALAAAGSA